MAMVDTKMDLAPTKMTCTKATPWKSRVAVLALIAIATGTQPAMAQDTENSDGPPPAADNSYGPPGASQCNPENYSPGQAMPPACMSQAYCDQYGCPDDFYDMPIWYGPVFYDNVWLGGPVYYRDLRGRRQYWIRGGWHYDAWRGPHPSWWNAGHYHTGPALGRGFQGGNGGGGATTSVRVWRGTQASTYYDGSGGRYYRGGFAGPETVPLVNGAGHSNTASLHAISGGQRASQIHFSGAHNSVGIRGHVLSKGVGGGHHGR
jgi:hypothetical protein